MVEWRLPGRVKRRKSFRRESDARAFEAEVIASRNRGVVIDPRRGDGVTVAHTYSAWLATRQDVSPKTRRGYEDNWRNHIEPIFGAWPVTKVDRASIQDWVNGMTVGPRTKRWRHTVLRMVLDHAVAEGWLVKNVAHVTNFPPLTQHQHDYLTADEVYRLAELCGPQGDVVIILALTGMRWGELIGLNVGDVDLGKRRAYVRRSITQVGGKLITGATKSKAGHRAIPIPTSLVPILAARINGRPKTAPAICSPRGARLGRENWVRAVQWKTQTAALGHPQLRIHDLRHTYASLARSAGADLRILMKAMGHASITVTAHTYADLYDGELDGIAEALDTLGPKYDGPPSTAIYDGPPEAH
jgi:integrase